MKSTNYFIIQGWMVNELELKGNNLLVFAIVYGFSQDGQSNFEGSLSYLCKSTGASKNTVIKSLNELIELGYITKQSLIRNNIVFNTYSQNEQVVQKLVQYGSETGIRGSAETGTNNTNNYNIDNNKEPTLLFSEEISSDSSKIEHNETIKKSSLKKEKEPAREILFSESKWNSYEVLRDYLKDDKSFVEKFSGVDLRHYISKADMWSENNRKKLRTDRGWLLSLRDWITEAKKNGNLATIPIKQKVDKEAGDKFYNV